MIYVCVICMVKRPPLSPLTAEHRTLLEAIVSPVINTADLQAFHSQWLACVTCKLLMQTVYNFQQTALVGVKNLKYLLLNLKTGPTVIEETKPAVNIKAEPTPEVSTAASKDTFITIEAPRTVNLLTEELDVKFEPEPPESPECSEEHEPETADCDTVSSASSESSHASSVKQPATSISAPNQQVAVQQVRVPNTQQVRVPDTQQVRVPYTQQVRVPNIQVQVPNTEQARVMPVIAVSEGKFEVYTHQPQPNQKPAHISNIRPKDGVGADQGIKKGKYIRKKPPRVSCPHCGKSIRDNCSLKVHITRLHGEISLCECDVCGKQCRNETALKYHKYNHRENKPNIIENIRPELFCKECCMQFPSPSAYRIHRTTLKHMPKEQYRFECEKCKAKFLDEKRRQQHIDVVHLRQREYKCDKCDKSYGTATGVRKHKIRVHEKRPRPPAICHLCGKTFTIRKSLKEHLLTHEGLRPHQCPLCPATFTYKAALYTHNRLKHLKIKGNWKKKKKKEVEKEGEEKRAESYDGDGVGELLQTI